MFNKIKTSAMVLPVVFAISFGISIPQESLADKKTKQAKHAKHAERMASQAKKHGKKHHSKKKNKGHKKSVPIHCGDVLSEPGRYRLEEDIECVKTIKVTSSDVHIDLAGHSIRCDDVNWVHDPNDPEEVADPNVFVTGIEVNYRAESQISGVHITNGTISGCSQGVLLENTDRSKVDRMKLIDNTLEGECCDATGIMVVNANDNHISKNVMKGNGVGIGVFFSSDNKIDHNDSSDNSIDGIAVLFDSNNNHFVGNTLNRNGQAGLFVIAAHGNLMRANRVYDNAYGVFLASLLPFGFPMATDNVVDKNKVGNSGKWDLLEAEYLKFDPFEVPGAAAEECSNIWRHNSFGSEYGPLMCLE